MQEYIAQEFCSARLLVRLMRAISISSVSMEWYSVNTSFPEIVRMPDAPDAFHLASFARRRNATTKEGKFETSPSQMMSRGADAERNADDPTLDAKSKGSFVANGS